MKGCVMALNKPRKRVVAAIATGGVFGKWTHRVDDRRLIGCDSSEQVLVQAERCRWRMVLPGQ